MEKFLNKLDAFASRSKVLLVAATLSVLLIFLQGWFSTFYGDRVLDSYSYYFAAQALNQGQNPYDAALLKAYGQEQGIENVYPYLYPPLLAIAFRPLVGLGPLGAHHLLTIVNALIVALTFYLFYKLVTPKRYRYAWFFLFFVFQIVNHAVAMTLRLGQINPLVMLAVVLCLYLHLKNRESLSALALSFALLLKLTPAILLIYFLIFTPRRWIYLAKTVGWSFVLIAGSCLFTAPVNWPNFLQGAQQGPPFRTFESFWGALVIAAKFIPLLASVKAVIFLALALVLLILTVRSIRRMEEAQRALYAFSMLMLLSMFVSPLTWPHHYYFCLLTYLYLPVLFWETQEAKRFWLFLILMVLALLHIPKPLVRPLGGGVLLLISFARTAAAFGTFLMALRIAGKENGSALHRPGPISHG